MEPLKNTAAQDTETVSGFEDPLPHRLNDTGFVATSYFEGSTLTRVANQGNPAEASDTLYMDESTDESEDYGIPLQPTAKSRGTRSFLKEGVGKKIECAEQKWRSGRSMFKQHAQLSCWRDTGCDEDESPNPRTSWDTIRDSIEQATSNCLGPLPALHCSDAGPSRSSCAVVNRILETTRIEDTVSISTPPNGYSPRVLEWRQRTQSFVPATGGEPISDSFGTTRFSAVTKQPTGMHTGLAHDFGRNVLQPGQKNNGEPSEQLYGRAPRLHLPEGSGAHTSEQNHTSPRRPSQAANNENTRSRGSRTVMNTVTTARGPPVNGVHPGLPRLNQDAAQTIPAALTISHMESPSTRRFPASSYSGKEVRQGQHAKIPSAPSTNHVANDLSPLLTNKDQQSEYEITGYHRSDPTVLWADSIPSPFAPPEKLHPASHLPGNGFLGTLSVDDSGSSSGSGSRGADHAAISFVEPDAPSSLPAKLLAYLNEKKERIRRHAEGDRWRAKHAADVVRRHEEHVFAKRAEDGDWSLKGWHMSSEYHGQPSGARWRGPRGGRAGGRGGRGRGRGGGPGGLGGMGRGF